MPPCLLPLLLLVGQQLFLSAVSATAANFYLLPAGHPRCRGAASRLRCLDQSLLLEANAEPDESLLDAFLLCNSSWAALGCQRDDVGQLAWRLAFRLSAVPCGQRFVLASALASPLLGQAAAGSPPDRLVEFTCRSHAYPVVYRPRYRFTSITWYSGRSSFADSSASPSSSSSLPSSSPSPVVTTISAHVYAEFASDVSTPADRAFLCEFRGGFWCGGGAGGLGCVYGTHRCNGLDDCLNSTNTASANTNETLSAPADEADCRYFDNGAASGLLSDGIWRQERNPAAASTASSFSCLALLLCLTVPLA